MAEKEYIEREAAVNGLAKIINESDMPEDWNKGMSAAMSALFRIPAADVRPVVRARWIHVPSDGKFRDTCVCSACKKSPPIESWVAKGFNACPYCFADMREES